MDAEVSIDVISFGEIEQNKYGQSLCPSCVAQSICVRNDMGPTGPIFLWVSSLLNSSIDDDFCDQVSI